MDKKKTKTLLRVVELFAGVGGFRLGLERTQTGRKKKKPNYEVIWSNQWEPLTKIQHASDIYTARFGKKNHSKEDINKVIDENFQLIPDHDLLVGGFPCQDYSVARTLGEAYGLIGKKGVLWWSIHHILKKKAEAGPDFLMLENVDRLLKSPAKQRGRDFAIMLASLHELDYIVEWRIINAADYGMPQRRRRVFIIGYRKGTSIYNNILTNGNPYEWLLGNGVMNKAFPIEGNLKLANEYYELKGDLADISEKFVGESTKVSPFNNSGIMIERKVYTLKGSPKHNGKHTLLQDILVDEKDVPKELYIAKKDIPQWRYLKGAKKVKRKSKSGHTYHYAEGPMVFPDALEKPARTIVTGEGGSTPSRFKHVVKTKSGKYRRLMPVELERLNMFPPRHTEGATDTKRAFLMGNALVVGVIKKLGESLYREIISNN